MFSKTKTELKNSSFYLTASICLLGSTLCLQMLVNPVLGALINGNDFDNSLYGTMLNDNINGRGGNDNLFGLSGNDAISGGSGNDFIQGDEGDDNLMGDDGNDYVQGGSGKDTINGGPGNDTLISSFVIGYTTIRDFEPDHIICGDGFDTAFINLADNDTASSDCEVVVPTQGLINVNQTKEWQSPTNQTQSQFLPLD